MSGDRSTELLVVGAGPVGSFAALCAARAGIRTIVIDQTFRGFGRGYATLLHPASVRLLREAGLGAKLESQGRAIHAIGVHGDDASCVRLNLSSPALAVSQTRLEDALMSALRRTDVEVLAPCEAGTLQQDALGVRVRVVRRELVTLGSPAEYSDWQPVESFTINAAFVLGADGYDSRVRGALGIDVAKLGETETFAMFEVPARDDASSDLELGFAHGLGSAIVPLPGARARLGFELDSGLDLTPDAARLHELLSTRAPWYPDGLRQVDWGSVIHFERRLVRRFGRGRVWLAGDAAHVTSPFGAQSMNLGLGEVHDLVQRMAGCLFDGRSLETLQEYSSDHQREWHKLLGYHVKFDLLPHAPAWVGASARRIAPTLPASGAELKDLLMQLGLDVT